MTGRGRALLINALVFPGMGQLLVLRRRLAGGVLVAGSLAALLGLCWAVVRQWLALLPGAPDTLALESPWLLVNAMLELVRTPAPELWFWLLLLGAFWAAALVDAALFPSRSQGAAP